MYFSLTYLVPITAMGICYGRISCVLWGKSTLRENACNDQVHQRKLIAKRKVIIFYNIIIRPQKHFKSIFLKVYKLITFSSFSGCQNVYSSCNHLCNLLVTVPHVFHRHLSLQRGNKNATYSARIPWILLASNGKLDDQSCCLLLDELKVFIIL